MSDSLKKWLEKLAKDKSFHVVMFDYVLTHEKRKKHKYKNRHVLKPPEKKAN